jgi:DNA polymerase-4
MREGGRAGRTVTVRVRFAEMVAVTRSLTLPQPVASTLTLTEIAERLAWHAIDEHPGRDVTLLAISVSQLTDQRQLQLELDLDPPDPWRPGSPPGAARWAVDASMDAIRQRFGRDAVGYAPALLGRYGLVPDEFRELAEHDV